MMLFCTKWLSTQTNKRMATSASLCEGPIIYFYVFTFYTRVKALSSIPFYFLLGKHHVVWKDLGRYTQLDMSDHGLLLLTSPLR